MNTTTRPNSGEEILQANLRALEKYAKQKAAEKKTTSETQQHPHQQNQQKNTPSTSYILETSKLINFIRRWPGSKRQLEEFKNLRILRSTMKEAVGAIKNKYPAETTTAMEAIRWLEKFTVDVQATHKHRYEVSKYLSQIPPERWRVATQKKIGNKSQNEKLKILKKRKHGRMERGDQIFLADCLAFKERGEEFIILSDDDADIVSFSEEIERALGLKVQTNTRESHPNVVVGVGRISYGY